MPVLNMKSVIMGSAPRFCLDLAASSDGRLAASRHGLRVSPFGAAPAGEKCRCKRTERRYGSAAAQERRVKPNGVGSGARVKGAMCAVVRPGGREQDALIP